MQNDSVVQSHDVFTRLAVLTIVMNKEESAWLASTSFCSALWSLEPTLQMQSDGGVSKGKRSWTHAYRVTQFRVVRGDTQAEPRSRIARYDFSGKISSRGPVKRWTRHSPV